MEPILNIDKLIEITNLILTKNSGQVNYTWLLKVLYLADKASIAQYGYPISGDTYSALPNGPILSQLYSLISHSAYEHKAKWDTFFVTEGENLKSRQNLKFEADELSGAEMEILENIEMEFHNKNWKKIVKEILHDPKKTPEWKHPKEVSNTNSVPIDIEKIYLSIGEVSKKKKDFEVAYETYSQNINYSQRVVEWARQQVQSQPLQ